MTIKIAFRNIFRQKRRTLLTTLTMFGGFTLCSFSIAWMDGSYANVIDLFTRNQLGHIQIHHLDYLDRPSLYRNIGDYESIGRLMDGIDGVEAWAPRVFSAGLASVGEKTTGVRIVGVDPLRETAATRLDKKVAEGELFSNDPSHEALLGRGLAKRLHASIGDEVVVVSQGADGSIANDLYVVTGLVDSGDEIADQSAFYLHLHDAQELLVLEGRVHELAVVSGSIRNLRRLADRIEGAVARPGLIVETWQEFARSFYDAMRADQQGNWISIVIIVLLVAIGVLNTVLMSVLERTREYGLLRAVGTTPIQVFTLVIIEVFIMAIISVIVGFVASYILNYSLSFTGMSLPVSIDYGGVTFSEMYTEINVRSYVIPLLCVVSSAIFISFFPAIKAARTQPAEAMRSH
jgi:ABC-type lipoprotein release transport system permease subunit